MSDRSSSFLKRFKTQKHEKQNNYTWRHPNKTPKAFVNRTEARSPGKTSRALTTKIQLKGLEEYYLNCTNHHQKRALFELRDSMDGAYCSECSIRMVKTNSRLLKLSEKNLCLRAFYQAEMEKITSYEEQIHELVSKYFEAQRQSIKFSFIQAKEKEENTATISYLKVSQCSQEGRFFEGLKKMIGALDEKSYEFSEKYRPEIRNQSIERDRKARALTTESQGRSESSQNWNKQNIFNGVNVSLEQQYKSGANKDWRGIKDGLPDTAKY